MVIAGDLQGKTNQAEVITMIVCKVGINDVGYMCTAPTKDQPTVT